MTKYIFPITHDIADLNQECTVDVYILEVVKNYTVYVSHNA